MSTFCQHNIAVKCAIFCGIVTYTKVSSPTTQQYTHEVTSIRAHHHPHQQHLARDVSPHHIRLLPNRRRCKDGVHHGGAAEQVD